MSKIKVYHGLWNSGSSHTRSGGHYFPMPLKLRKLLEDKAVKFNMDTIEFTYAFIPELHVGAVAIVHPLDFFCKKVGYKIVMDRIQWIVKERMNMRDVNYKSWAYSLI